MRYLLSKNNLRALGPLAAGRVLLGFDFDGTLAPIVSQPERAAMGESTRELLGQLARRRPCVLISGRAQADALKRVRGIGFAEVVGNHGIEPWMASDRFLEEIQGWRASLEASLRRLPGVELEDKLFSLALHYRRCRNKEAAREAIERAAHSLAGARLVPGKMVVNVLPNGAPTKGEALAQARSRLRAETALYVGDDETDEDVFALGGPGLIGVRVGAHRDSRAGFFIRSQAEIDDLLEALLAVTPPPALPSTSSSRS
ncbi:MAG: trehalose-phosphatase [Myxococcales bacterium]|nr:trehalose-phosphatase [Myxococcales bacterium]